MSSIRSEARRIFAAFLAAHGLAHTLAFAVAWRLTHAAALRYTTEVLGGRLDVGGVRTRIAGALWLLAAAVLVFAAVRVWSGRRGVGPAGVGPAIDAAVPGGLLAAAGVRRNAARRSPGAIGRTLGEH